MKVKFYVLQQHTETTETRELFLVEQDWALMITGKSITHEGTDYRVDRLEWIDQAKGVLKAICLQLPARTAENTDATRPQPDL